MSEYVFRYAPGHGFSEGMTMEDGRTSAREYDMQENSDHYGTIHEEIVRCRDCAFFVANVSTIDKLDNVIATGNVCEWTELWVEPDGFCAWAVRAE